MNYSYANKGRKPYRDWSKVDWSKSSKELAQIYNMTPSNISRIRSRFAPETLIKHNETRKSKIDWFGINWYKKTSQIAKETGMSASYVSRKRREIAPCTLEERVFLNI